MLAGVPVRDGGFGGAPGDLPDEHRAGRCGGLDPAGGVHEVAGHHALALGADRHRRLAGEHAGPGGQIRRADLLAQRGHCVHELERRADRSLGVVLLRRGRSPDGHDRVPDELLHGAAVAGDHGAPRLEIP